MLQILNVVVSFFGAFEHFLRLIKCHLPFIWIFCFCLFLFPFASLFRFRFGFPFGFLFGFRFGFPFRFLFGFPFGFLFGSDNLISLSYSEAGFSANLFGLFKKRMGSRIGKIGKPYFAILKHSTPWNQSILDF